MNVYVNLSDADYNQLYRNSLILYNGAHLVFILENADMRGYFLAYNLRTQEECVVEKDAALLKPVDRHLGMVNTKYGAAYTARRSAKLFSVGLTRENVRIYPVSSDHASREVMKFRDISIVDAYDNNYPTLDQALKKAKDIGYAVAFDKSFAVTTGGIIVYRNAKPVGNVKPDGEIVFSPGFTHLQHRIGDSNGKDYQPV